MAGRNQRQIIREHEELRAVTAKVLQLLRPVEKELEYYLRDVFNAKVMALGEFGRSKREQQEIAKKIIKATERDLNAAVKKASSALRKGINLIDLFFPSMAAYIDALNAVSTLNAATVEKATIDAVYQLTLMRFADAVGRLATFYTGKLGIATLSAAPNTMLTIWMEEDPIDRLSQAIDDGFAINALADAAKDTEDILGGMIVDIIREKMYTTNVPALGGGYSAPISNTGNLAANIGILRGQTQRRYRRGRVGVGEAFQINVGLLPNASNRANIYGNILNRTYSSKPHSGPVAYSSEVLARLRSWGAQRGISDREMKYVIAKIWSRGTYGRNWFATIISDITEVDVPEQLIMAFEQHMQKAIDEVTMGVRKF